MKTAIVAIVSAMACNLLQAVPAHADDSDVRLRVVGVFNYPRPDDGGIRVRPSGIYYSAYSANGNDHDFIRIDPATGALEILAAGVRSGRVIAFDNRYILMSQGVSGTSTQRLVLRNRMTGLEARSIRLDDSVHWASIREGEVLVLQPKDILTFSIPDLRLTGKRPVDIPGWPRTFSFGRLQQPWKDNLVLVADDLVILGPNGEIQAKYPLPRRTEKRGGCDVSWFQVAADTAFVNPGCDLIRAVDLNTGTSKFQIEVGRGGGSFAILDDILFVADDPDASFDRLRMFDSRTGRFLGVATGSASAIAAAGRRLVLLTKDGDDFRKPLVATAYEPDAMAIRDDAAAESRLLAGCASFAANDAVNEYQAIDQCDAAGIRRFVEDLDRAPPSPAVRQVLLNYALWLADSWSRFEESIPILDGLGIADEYQEVVRGVRRKVALIAEPMDEPSAAALPSGVRELGRVADGPPQEPSGDAEEATWDSWKTKALRRTRSYTLSPSAFSAIHRRDMIRYEVFAKNASNPDFLVDASMHPGILVDPGSDLIVFQQRLPDGVRLMSLDLNSRRQETLLEFAATSDWGPIERFGRHVFIAHGRDLMTFDLERRTVIGYERNIIRGGLKPVCLACSDGNGIRRLEVNGDRLVALTLSGLTSLEIEVPKYVESMGTGSPFSN